MSSGRESPSERSLAERLKRLRLSQASIGQIIFGSFLLLLAIIVGTSVVSVLAIHRLNDTFTELQRLQRVGDLAEEIDRRMSELRLAARDFLSEPNPQAVHVREPATALAQLLQDARPELALDQKDMIDGVIARLSNYREGFEKIATLTDRRRELIAQLPALDEHFNAAVVGIADRDAAANLLRDQSKIAAAMLARDTAAAEKSARDMRGVGVAEPAVRSAVDAYADDIVELATTEAEIVRLDSEVLGNEGRLIARVTDLLRDVSAQRGHTLADGFARTLFEARWQSIMTGIVCLLVGLSAAVFVVRRTVRPLAAIAAAIRALAAGSRDTAIPDTELHNEIGDIARAAEVFRQTREEADAAREAAVRALAEQKLAEESYEKLFEMLDRRHLCHDPAGPDPQRQSGAGAHHGLQLAGSPDQRHQQHRGFDLCRSGGARGIRAADGARRHGARLRVPGAATRRRHPLAVGFVDRRARRTAAASSATKARSATSPTRSAPRPRSPTAAAGCRR